MTEGGRQPLRRVVIVGGGTAGWMTAAALSRLSAAHQLELTLVESDEIGTVGVGEATIPSLRDFHAMLGVDETEFMRATGATFKLGILFENWGALGETYLHPFGSYGVDAQGVRFHQLWLRLKTLQAATDYVGPLDEYNLTASAALAGRFSRSVGEVGDRLATVSYAFHLDAGRYAQWLRGYAEPRGVQRVEGRIDQVILDGQTGFVAALRLAGGGEVQGDLFIDCSGFRGLVIGDALKVGYQDWSHWLPCDRAVAVPTATVEPPRAYTRAMADSAGWRWRIPLQHRVGNGFVYCSDHLDDQAAHDRLLDTIDGAPIAAPRLIRFQPGRRDAFWQANCVAIGLSAGFIEPLESTSIHLIQSGIARLLALFPDQSFDPIERAAYNKGMTTEYEQVRDFIILHYKQTVRTDTPFWSYVRQMPIPDSLADKMALFQAKARLLQGEPHLFTDDSWVAVMLGQGLAPRGYDPLAEALPLDETRRFLRHIRKRVADTVASMPSHDHFIAANIGAAGPTIS